MYASIGIGSKNISYFKDEELLPNEATKVNIADDNHIRNDTDMRTDVFIGMLRAHSIKKFTGNECMPFEFKMMLSFMHQKKINENTSESHMLVNLLPHIDDAKI